jgi:hypothetical protein
VQEVAMADELIVKESGNAKTRVKIRIKNSFVC